MGGVFKRLAEAISSGKAPENHPSVKGVLGFFSLNHSRVYTQILMITTPALPQWEQIHLYTYFISGPLEEHACAALRLRCSSASCTYKGGQMCMHD